MWSAPRTWTDGERVTSAHLNAVRDQLAVQAAAAVTAALQLPYADAANHLAASAAFTASRLARVNSAGTGIEGVSVDDLLPWYLHVAVPWGLYASETNWSTRVHDSGSGFRGYLQSSGAQDAEAAWPVVLAAGTWAITLAHRVAPANGIYSVRIDGVEVGTVDGYRVSPAAEFAHVVTGVAVAATGKKSLSLKMATKNASASAYTGQVRSIHLLRTA